MLLNPNLPVETTFYILEQCERGDLARLCTVSRALNRECVSRTSKAYSCHGHSQCLQTIILYRAVDLSYHNDFEIVEGIGGLSTATDRYHSFTHKFYVWKRPDLEPTGLRQFRFHRTILQNQPLAKLVKSLHWTVGGLCKDLEDAEYSPAEEKHKNGEITRKQLREISNQVYCFNYPDGKPQCLPNFVK